ncbi:unnamed protein product [Aureobasidium pullulans]|nr:unnamed protein product [Aureobasidium pullulans]
MANDLEKHPQRTQKPVEDHLRTDVDAALQLLRDRGSESGTLDPEQNRRLLRRIDLHIMPLICIVYFLQYLDKIAISYASVTGIKTSANLRGTQFNWIASIFFFGQLLFEFPTIRLIQLFPLANLMVCRALLGVAEAAVVPAWVVFTSAWYRKEEQAFRVGIWFSMCGFAQMFGGFFSYGVANHVGGDVQAALQGWQIIFLFLGLLTSVVGIVFWFFLPDSPLSAKFLSTEEKALHAERMRQNEQGIGNRIFEWNQFWEAIRDVNTWFHWHGLYQKESLLLVTPLGAYEVVVLIGLTYLAGKTNQRLWCCIAGHIPSIVGAILMATTNKVPALIGFYLTGGIPIGWTTILALQSTNVAGSTKKITVTSIGVIAYTVGNIISPQTFQTKDAPRYLPAKISICILYFLITVDLYLIRWFAVRENRRRDKEREELGDKYVVEENHEFLDLTDRENKEFRYAV